MILLPGAELGVAPCEGMPSFHVSVIGTDHAAIVTPKRHTLQKLINANVKKGNIVTLNHPDWRPREHYTIDELIELKGYTGIEIYNSVIERLPGSPLSTAKWDRLLGSGRRGLGFAAQDAHQPYDYCDCGCVVCVNQRTPAAVLKALQQGNFYCHYGVTITDIGRQRNRIYVKTKNARLIRFIGEYGVVLAKTKGKSGTYTFTKAPADTYVRVECLGVGEQISWSQPFFRNA